MMTHDEIRKALQAAPQGYIDWDDASGLPFIHFGRITLDGEFSLPELQALVELMKQHEMTAP